MESELSPESSVYQLVQDQENSSQSHQRTAIASGYLHKLAHGKSPIRVWHQRYYVLYSDGLMYSYYTDRSKRSHRTIPVGRLCLRMRFGQDTIKSRCEAWPSTVPIEQRFSLVNSDRSYYFYTESETELSTWKHYLQSTLERLSSPPQTVIDDEDTHNTEQHPTLDSSSKSSSEQSLQFVHATNSPVDDMVEATFGEITTFLQ